MEVLNYADSGARKYIRILLNAGVIKISHYIDATSAYRGRPVFIRVSEEASQKFLASMLDVEDLPAKLSVAPGITRHLLGRTTYPRKQKLTTTSIDSMALSAAFFKKPETK